MNRSFAVAALAGTTLVAALFSPAAARPIDAGHNLSWGKADVSLEEYWVDSSQCGHEAAATDLSDTDPGKALIYASRIMDNANNAGDMMAAAQLVHPEVQWDRAATIMRRALESCLLGRGYMKFRLTDGQARQLRMFENGSLERRRYLHSLASDPRVLEAQSLDG